MLDIKFIRENADLVKTSIKNRGAKVDIGKLLELDSERRELLKEAESLKHKKNVASDEIAGMLKEKKDASRYAEEYSQP